MITLSLMAGMLGLAACGTNAGIEQPPPANLTSTKPPVLPAGDLGIVSPSGVDPGVARPPPPDFNRR